MTGPPDRSAQLRARMDQWEVNPLGLGFLAPGVVLLLISYTALQWFRGIPHWMPAMNFLDVHSFLNTFHDFVAGQFIRGIPFANFFSTGLSDVYYSWLGWLLFVLATAGTIAVNSRLGQGRWSVRWAAAVVCAAGLGLTFASLSLILVQGNPPTAIPRFGDYLANTGVGPWAALLGYLMLFISCFVPRRDW